MMYPSRGFQKDWVSRLCQKSKAFREGIRTDLHETKYAVGMGIVDTTFIVSLEFGSKRGALAEGSVLHRCREER